MCTLVGKGATIWPVRPKSEVRAAARIARSRKPAGDGSAARHLLQTPEVLAAKTISAYWGIDQEPVPQGIFTHLHERGVRLLLPIVNSDWSLDWGIFEGEGSLVQRRGLWEPTQSLGREAIADADVLITPGLRVDRRGVRLGQGAGCYDRALAIASAQAWVVMLLHDDEISEEVLPEESHDRRVDAVSTPSGIIRFDVHHA